MLLNDPIYVEAARAFAARIVREGGGSDDERVAWAWRQALQRPPRVEELEIVLPVLRRQRADYARDPDAAAALVKVGLAPAPDGVVATELAAWTHVARILLNLHETITRN